MKTEQSTCIIRSGGLVALVLLAVMATASGIFARPCFGLPQSVPSRIADLNTGVSQADLLKKIVGDGEITTEGSEDKRGPVVTWNLTDSPYYENVSFRFTEKDRLFLIRFTLKSSARQQFAALKEDFFGKYDFSPEKPFHLRRQDEDILLYGPNSGASLFFIEFTNTKTGKKYYEVFNRTISGEDRPMAPPPQEGEKTPTGAQGAAPADASKPGGELSTGSPSGQAQDPSGKVEQPAPAAVPSVSKEPQVDKAPEAK